MRIVLHNPHANVAFSRTVLDSLLRLQSYKKYRYILDYLITEKKDFVIYYDGKDSSLPTWLSRYVPDRVEIFLWCLINNIDPLKVRVISNIYKMSQDDIFFSFSLRNLDRNYSGLDNIPNKPFLKIFHLTHFVQNTSLISKNAHKLDIDFLIAENNLFKNSAYFRKHFRFYKKDVYTLPFVFQNRFVNRKHFKKRKNKCIATGTLVNIQETGDPSTFTDFYNFFKSHVLQPEREKIYTNKSELKDVIDSYVSELYEKKLKKNKTVSVIRKILNKFHNSFISTKRSYFSFDIIEKYNDYKMFINGEEINDLPGIGMVEGMACGTAYIGKRDPMYTDLGMIDKVHYIGYDGTIADLRRKILYYQKHSDKLEKIAENGTKFVREKFNAYAAAETLYKDLAQLMSTFKSNNYKKKNLKWRCTFTNTK